MDVKSFKVIHAWSPQSFEDEMKSSLKDGWMPVHYAFSPRSNDDGETYVAYLTKWTQGVSAPPARLTSHSPDWGDVPQAEPADNGGIELEDDYAH